MRLAWVRDSEKISFNHPSTWFALGQRGEGKSSLLEHVGEIHLERGDGIVDILGSADGEALAWCRSPWAKTRKILLLHSPSVDVNCSFNTLRVTDLKLSNIESHDLIISASPLYSNLEEELGHISRVINLLLKRLSWSRIIGLICREASNLIYSRIRAYGNQAEAKAFFVWLCRQARHFGISLLLDSQRFMSIDIDVRDVIDYLAFKSLGVPGLPSDLTFLYGFFNPHIFRRMPKENFVMLTRRGSIGLGSFPEVKWHKQERENILRACDIKVTYGEEIEYPKSRGTFETVGDMEHTQIIGCYVNDELSMATISRKLGRSSATVKSHIDRHNEAVERSGFCPVCRRAGGQHYKEKAIHT